MRARRCRTCDAVLTKRPGPGRWPRYCSPECKQAARAAADRARTAGRRPCTVPCGDCGRPVAVAMTGPLPRRCHACKVRAWRANQTPRDPEPLHPRQGTAREPRRRGGDAGRSPGDTTPDQAITGLLELRPLTAEERRVLVLFAVEVMRDPAAEQQLAAVPLREFLPLEQTLVPAQCELITAGLARILERRRDDAAGITPVES